MSIGANWIISGGTMFDWIEICLALATTALLACAFMPQLRAYRPLFLGGSALTGRSQWSKCRIYFMQSWFNLSDPQAEDVYDIESTRRFTDIDSPPSGAAPVY